MRQLTITQALKSASLFGPYFDGDSWRMWRAVLKATFCEPLSNEEVALFREVAGERMPPTKRCKELTVIAGRGAGKDSAASLIAAYVALCFDRKPGKMRPGERAIVMLLAVDRDQARVAFNYLKGLFEEIAVLWELVVGITADSIELSNGAVIEVHTNSYRSVRGRSLLCVIADEVAFWRDESSSDPDVETLAAVGPGLARVVGSMLILISSAHRRAGVLYSKWRDHYGKDIDDRLCVLGTTLQFNPSFDRDVVDRALADDPQRYGAEYNSVWRDDLAAYVSRELLDRLVDRDVKFRAPVPVVRYHAFTDPSGGGGGDSFTMAVAHQEPQGSIILDQCIETKPPFSAEDVVKNYSEILREYRCLSVVGDRYAGAIVSQLFAKHGVQYVFSHRDRSAVYTDALPLMTSGKVHFLDHPRMIGQLAGLERRIGQAGRDRIDHPIRGSDDLSNSACGALVLAADRWNHQTVVMPILVRGARRSLIDIDYNESSTRNPAHGLPLDGRDSWSQFL